MRAIPESVAHWAREKPDAPALCLLDGDGNAKAEISWRALDEAAGAAAGALARAGCAGRPLLLVAEPTAAFVAALCGAMRAGAVAAPVPPSARPRAVARLERIVSDGGIAHALAAGPASADVRAAMPGLHWCDADGAATPDAAPVRGDAPALLQYTSGSTAAPKGVVLTHANIAANLDMLQAGFAASPESRILSWLPLHHDMGLVGQLLLALHCGATLFLMSPLAFVRRPQAWLRAVAAHRATISGGPNFAFELCLRRPLPPLGPHDLAGWTVAFCGAERVRPETLRRFAARLAPFGFDAQALLPCYGLAEATVYVSGGPPGRGLRCAGAAGAEVASCGRAAGTVAIVDPTTGLRVPDGCEGEIWLAGPHVAAGYRNRAADDAFGRTLGGVQGALLRTGDTGFLRAGDLFVTGRVKDLIIHRGENLHPEDIEATIAASDDRFGAAGCVFTLDEAGDERVVAIWEAPRGLDEAEAAAMRRTARLAVADAHAIRLDALVLIAPGQIPRTTSGKVQRGLSRERYRTGALGPRVGGQPAAAPPSAEA